MREEYLLRKTKQHHESAENFATADRFSSQGQPTQDKRGHHITKFVAAKLEKARVGRDNLEQNKENLGGSLGLRLQGLTGARLLSNLPSTHVAGK